MTSLSISQARAALPGILDRVAEGQEVTITRHGQPVAVLVSPDALRHRRADAALVAAARIGSLVRNGRRAELAGLTGLSAERAEEMVAALRAERDRSKPRAERGTGQPRPERGKGQPRAERDTG